MCRITCVAVSAVLLVASVGGQVPDKAADGPEITPEWLRRSSLGGKSPESAEIKYVAQAGERAYPAFEVILADPKCDSRLVMQIVTIVASHSKVDRGRFLPLLRTRLTDPDAAVRMWTVLAVGQIGTKEDLPALAAFLSSDHEWTVKTAASAVAQIGGEAGLAALDVWLLSARDRDAPDLRKHITERRDDLKRRLDKEQEQAKKPKS